ncbi:hypothetical protein [Shewanella sp. SR43-8]|uniref:hypothetical protein n=1 Tax=Shewanella sp. SR43-8 TaxID=2760938 RepID=UPI001600E0F5|nr:hypothetical protein [Shewanella sp. SR43-8]MBB1322110.1 hypothetical protein [Shewanella sp. SR43-8]
MIRNFKNAHNYLYLHSHKEKFLTLFNNDYRSICDYFDVNKATAYRWIKAGLPGNKTALRLLDVAASGYLPCNLAWNGYFIFNDRLITKSGFVLSAWELDSMCETLGRDPTAFKVMNQTRNFKPWRDREPEFVKKLRQE